jgi:hypothetical protein
MCAHVFWVDSRLVPCILSGFVCVLCCSELILSGA